MKKGSSSAKAVRTIGFMAVIIFCAKFMGLLRETLIASVYGQGYSSDVLNTSTQIPLLFFDMTLGVAILSTFVPVFNNLMEREGKERALGFANNFMTVVVLFAAIAAFVGMIFAKPVMRLMVPGYDAAKVSETAYLLRILFPSIIFTAAAYTAVGILQSFGEFNVPSIISVVSNLIMIAYLLLFGNRCGLVGVVLSMVAAWASQLLVQIPHLRKFGFRFRPRINLRDEGILEAAHLAVPVLISSWVQPLCVVINMAFGSSMGDGAVSGLNWANKIYIIAVGVFAYAVTNFIFPRLSRLGAGENASADDTFAETTRISVGWVVFIIGYIAAMLIALSTPVIRIVFERGEFTADNTLLTARALMCYSFGMIGYAICEILNKSFYAIHDGKTPMFISMLGVVANFAAAFVLVRVLCLGVSGLALASAVSSSVMAAALLVMINKRKRGTVNARFVLNVFKIIICGGASAFFAYVLYGATAGVGTTSAAVLLRLFVSASAALVVYVFLAFLLKTDEISQIRRFGHEK